MLWPDSGEAQARTNLRNLLHVVRNAVPAAEQCLEVTASSLRWRIEPQWNIDVVALRSAAEHADQGERGSDAELAALREVARLYTGDLLEDCYDEWVLTERERLRDRVVALHRRLADSLSQRQQHDEALRVSREVTRLDPFEEEGYRLRMRVHAAAGDRAGAMRVYHECAAVLVQELGVEPSGPTRRLYIDLTRADKGLDDVDQTAPLTSGFVGRVAELERMQACWRDAQDGRPQLLLVTGEAGIGKTRLADELAAWAAHRGVTVAHARSYAAEGDLGFGVVASWLRNAEVLARLRHSQVADCAELSRIVPELGEPGAPPQRSVAELDTLRLFDAAALALTSRHEPLLLVVDDAQWSDAPSLQFVHYLMRREATSALLVVATVRREDLGPHHPLVSLVDALTIADTLTEVALGRLSPAETHALASDLTGSEMEEQAADALYAETEGNPLFVVETARARSTASSSARSMTPRLRAVIDSRLAQMNGSARRVLEVAATIGRSFTPQLLAAAGRLDDDTIVEGLDELWRRGLVREHGVDAYDFSHGKIREAAYEALRPATRQRTHLDVARALVDLNRTDTASVSGQVAINFDRAGRGADAIDWYERAAREALVRSAYGEAVRFLERAHTLTVALGSEGPRRELQVLSMLSAAIAADDSYASPHQLRVQERAIAVAKLLKVDLDPTLLRSLVMTNLCGDRFEEARTAADRLRRSATEDGDEGLAVESEYLLGISAFWACDVRSARDHFETVVERFRGDDRLGHAVRFAHDPRIVCASRLANTLWFLGDTLGAVAMRERALALARDTPHPYSADVAKVFAAVLAVDLGDVDDIRARAAELSAGRERSWVFDVNAEAMNGLVGVLDGRAAEGIARIEGAIESLGPSSPAPGAISTLTRVLVAALEFANDPAAGLTVADRALRLPGTRLWEAEIRRARAEFRARSGHPWPEVEADLATAARFAEAHAHHGPGQRIAATRSRLLADERH